MIYNDTIPHDHNESQSPFQPSIASNSHAIYPHSMKTISISTRTNPNNNDINNDNDDRQSSATTTVNDNDLYRQMNTLLHSVHVERFGDPEGRENEWDMSHDMEIDKLETTTTPQNEQYQSANSILKQAFLQRRYLQQ
ncbi:MAG: hypothetical protein EXX96DRAFT_555657 [Benjaminiella poitrasii]|nr:MAG: hypothetical protein EXX96DRAFT_555657 [Benjaminiella poitrasii]